MGTASVLAEFLPDERRLSNNVIANAVDSLTAELTQQLARPMFVSTGGTWEDFNRARKLTSWMDLEFDKHEVDVATVRVILDGLICGTGVARWVRDGSKVRLERIFPAHVLADDRACVDVMPRSFFLRQIVDRHYLADQYKDDPELYEKIMGAGVLEHDQIWAEDTLGDTEDVVSVYEAWRLGKNGRHILCVEGALLFDEKYDRDEPPLCFYRPLLPARGFFGDPPIQRVIGLQLELNKINQRIQNSMHLHSRLITFVDRASRVVKDHITNSLASIIEYDGKPPTFVTPQAMSAEAYKQRKEYMTEVYEGLGVNEMSAKGTIPRGMSDASGVALELYSDTESKRFVNQKRFVDRFRVALARERVEVQDQMGDNKVLIERRGVISPVKWGDIKLDEDAMHVQIQPTGSLPATPGGKAKRLEAYMKAGILQADEYLLVADDPDLERVSAIRLAPIMLLEQMFEDMLSGGEYKNPEPYMDLNRGLKMCAMYLQMAELHGAPEEAQEMLRSWLAEAHQRLSPPPPPISPDPSMMPLPGGAPPPMPSPTAGQAPTPGLMPPSSPPV